MGHNGPVMAIVALSMFYDPAITEAFKTRNLAVIGQWATDAVIQ